MVPAIEPDRSSSGRPAYLATKNIQFNRILVATDFSAPAAQALKTAIAIARTFDSEILLVHAAPPQAYGTGAEPLPPDLLAVNLDRLKTKLNEWIANEAEPGGLSLKTIVAYGIAVALVERIANEQKADLIVVGSHGASGIERLTLGSVAENILRKMSCPVLVIGPNCNTQDHPLSSILFATDLETTGLRPAQFASALAESVNGRLTLLHVIEPRDIIPHEDLRPVEKQIKQQLLSLVPADAALFCSPKVRVEYGSPSKTIPEIARAESANLIVVGLRHRSSLASHALWSTLSRLIRESSCGVLVLHAYLD
ncbi:universal stress protein [Granulicella sp. dw_53]|uniref:universal stress protein n=1 Tax=Granulicella sp. dw_53 TaxID=2719792 RepID=UPI001BD349B2|nr:universal stress protein [Granulicella sp. dw_53]